MKVKKLTALALSLSMCFGTTGMANAEQNVNEEFFKEYENIATWEKMQSDSDTTFSAKIPSDSEEISGYKITANAKQDSKNLKSFMQLKFTPLNKDLPKIPDIKIYIDTTDLYINKEAINAFTSFVGIDKQFTKDFVKIDTMAGAKESQISSEMLNTLKNNPTEITKKAIKFIKGIDLGIDLGLKKEGNTYSLSWDADKTVDVINAYFKFFFTNPDYILNFYKDVLGIDMDKAFKEMGISTEEYKESLTQLNDLWQQKIQPILPSIKEAFKGTTINYNMTFDKDTFKSDLKSDIKVDANIISEQMKIIGGADKNIQAPQNSFEIPALPKMEFILNSNQNVKKDDAIDIKIPDNFETFDMQKLIEEENSKKQTQINNSNKKIYIISTTNSELTSIGSDGNPVSTPIKLKSVDGRIYVDAKTFEKSTSIKLNHDKENQMIMLREIADKNNLDIKWIQKTKEVIIANK